MAIWKKPNGIEFESNDKPATIEYCKSLDYKLIGESKTPEPVAPPAPEADTEEDPAEKPATKKK